MDPGIRIKKEKIDSSSSSSSSDDENLIQLPAPMIIPKVEPVNDLFAKIHEVQIKLEPKDPKEKIKENAYSDPKSTVNSDVPSIRIKNEIIQEKIDDTVFDNVIDILDHHIEASKNNIKSALKQQKYLSNVEDVEDGEIFDNSENINSLDLNNKDVKTKNRKHKKRNKSHKKRKIDNEITEQNSNTNGRKNDKKRTRDINSSDEYNFEMENSDCEAEQKINNEHKKQKIKKTIIEYEHASITPSSSNSNQNICGVLNLPKPTIEKVDPDVLLPKPKEIKIEKTELSREKVLERCKDIIENIKLFEKNNFLTKLLCTPVHYVTPEKPLDMENRSPLLCSKNVHYSFSSTAKINYNDLGMISLPECVAKLARVIGFDTKQLINLVSIKAVSSTSKSATDVNKSILSNINSYSSFNTNISTQTDQIPCDQCVLRQLRKGHDISVQTECEDELPMIKNFHMLNMNQQVALNNFYDEIVNGQPANANDKLKLRDRLVHIFDNSFTQQIINPPLTTQNILNAPPPPVLPSTSFSLGIHQSQLGYQAISPSQHILPLNAPPPPVLPSNAFNLGNQHSQVNYQAALNVAPPPVLPSNSYTLGIHQSQLGYQVINQPESQHYEQHYQNPQPMMAINSQRHLVQSQHIPRSNDPRNNDLRNNDTRNDPRINIARTYGEYKKANNYR